MNNKRQSATVQKLTVISILCAIVVLLQTFASAIKIGPFTFTLSLVPIIIGATLYGAGVGAILGGVFGIVVSIAVVTGADIGGYLMFQELPFVTIFLCLLKSTVAGAASGLISKALEKKNTFVGVITSSVACPVINTGILSVGMLLFYKELVASWALDAGYSSSLLYVILGVVGINFLIELGINLVLAPTVLRLIDIAKKRLKI